MIHCALDIAARRSIATAHQEERNQPPRLDETTRNRSRAEGARTSLWRRSLVDVSDGFSGSFDESAAIAVTPSKLCAVGKDDVESGPSGTMVLDYLFNDSATKLGDLGHVDPTLRDSAHCSISSI